MTIKEKLQNAKRTIRGGAVMKQERSLTYLIGLINVINYRIDHMIFNVEHGTFYFHHCL